MRKPPPYLQVSLMLDSPTLDRLYRQFEASIGDPGAISYRCIGAPGSGEDSVNLISWLQHTGWGWLHDRLDRIARKLNEVHWRTNIDGARELQFTRYEPGQGYGWHSDVNEAAGGTHARRTLSIVVLLRNPASGGGIEFRDGGVVPLTPGEAVVFPAATVHRAVPVVQGTRDSLIYWMGSDG